MTVTLDLSPEVEKRLTARAKDRGVSLTQYVQEMVEKGLELDLPSSVVSGREKARAFEHWARSHRDTPPLPDEAIRRVNLVRDGA